MANMEMSLNKGAWTSQEDEILTNFVNIHGEGKWRNVAQKSDLYFLTSSTTISMLRWLNYLKPGIKRGNVSVDEEYLIVRIHRLLGNRWALIARRLPDETDSEIKNYWKTIMPRKLLQHQPTTTMEEKPQEHQLWKQAFINNTIVVVGNKGQMDDQSSPNLFTHTDNILIQDVFSSDFLQNNISHDWKMISGDEDDNVEIGPTFNMELKRVPSFLELGD